MPAYAAFYKKLRLVFKKPVMTSRGPLYHKETFFLCLADRTNPARLGLGECGPLPGLSLDDRADFEAKIAQVSDLLNAGYSHTEIDLAEFPALAFGLELAQLDWQGGGRQLLFDTEFSRGRQLIPTHGLIWMSDRAGMLQQVRAKVALGFTCIKLKVGALDFREECGLLADIRRTYPPGRIKLRLDANGAFTPGNALARLNEMTRFDIDAIEQPLKPGQWAEMAVLSRRSPIPIALDEELIGVTNPTEKELLLKTIKPAYIVLKPSLVGGFAAAKEWIDAAQQLGIGWWTNSMLESNVGLSAICQWVSALETTITHGLGTGQLYANNIHSPIRLAKAGLIYDRNRSWDLSGIVKNYD